MEESRINKGLKRTAGMSLDDFVNACSDSDDEQRRSRSSRSRRRKSTVVAAKPPPIASVAATVATKPPPVNTSTSASSLVCSDDRKLAAPTTNEGRTLRSSKKEGGGLKSVGGGLKGVGGGLKRGGSDDDMSSYEYDEEDIPAPPSNKHRRKSSTKSSTQRTSSRLKKKGKKPNNKTSTKSNNTATATRKSSLNSSHPISLLTNEAKTNDNTLSLRKLQNEGVAAITSNDTGRTRSETRKKDEEEEEDREGEGDEWRCVPGIQGKVPIINDISGHNIVTTLQTFLGVKTTNRYLSDDTNMLTIAWEVVNESNDIAQFKSSDDGFVVNDRDAFLTACSNKRREMKKDSTLADFEDFNEDICTNGLKQYGFSRKWKENETTFTKAHFKGGNEGKSLAYRFKRMTKLTKKSRQTQKRIWLKFCELNVGYDRKVINAILDPTEAVDCNWAVAAAAAARREATEVVVFGPVSTVPTIKPKTQSGRMGHECRVVGCEKHNTGGGCCTKHRTLYIQLGSKRVYENGVGYGSDSDDSDEDPEEEETKVVVFGPVSTKPTKEQPNGKKRHECRVVGCENYEKDRKCGCCKAHTKLYKQLGSKRVYENGAGYGSDINEDPEEIEDQAASAMTSRSRTARSKKTSYKEDETDIEEDSDGEEDMDKKPAAKKKKKSRR